VGSPKPFPLFFFFDKLLAEERERFGTTHIWNKTIFLTTVSSADRGPKKLKFEERGWYVVFIVTKSKHASSYQKRTSSDAKEFVRRHTRTHKFLSHTSSSCVDTRELVCPNARVAGRVSLLQRELVPIQENEFWGKRSSSKVFLMRGGVGCVSLHQRELVPTQENEFWGKRSSSEVFLTRGVVGHVSLHQRELVPTQENEFKRSSSKIFLTRGVVGRVGLERQRARLGKGLFHLATCCVHFKDESRKY